VILRVPPISGFHPELFRCCPSGAGRKSPRNSVNNLKCSGVFVYHAYLRILSEDTGLLK
jgi:hypothetical protein